MTTRTKKLATLLTAGVALSSGAYALGSQAGDRKSVV
jgi:type II secretory pathway component PulF